MTTRRYEAIAYKQSERQDSPWIINFVAPAEEILEWVGIPRRTEKGLTGFQRLDDEARILRAKEYFDTSTNQSPTSLIVGIHIPPSESSRRVRLELTDDDRHETGPGAAIKKCILEVDIADKPSLDEVVAHIKEQIEMRLNERGHEEEEELPLDDEESEGEPDDSDEASAPDEEYDADDAVELGRSILLGLLDRLEDKEWCKQNEEDLRDLSKPATLIDGQHRLKGAELCERLIPFSVCALFDCPWSEQVFQFTIVNYTQKGIPDQFITANAALSLTSGELKQLENRLVQAKVKVVEYELMRVVNFDSDSPFYELVNLTERKNEYKIGYKTMVRIATAWYSGRVDAVAKLIDTIYPEVKGRKSEVRRKRLEKWKQGDWGDFFIVFWQTVRDNYIDQTSHEEGHYLWEVGYSNLMISIVLFELQARFFVMLNEQMYFFETTTDDPLSEMKAKLREAARTFVRRIPAEFFGRRWGLSSLNTGAGREALQDVLDKFVKDPRYKVGNHSIITGKIK